MQVNGPTHIHGAQPINAPHRANATQSTPPQSAATGADQLDISHEADMISRVREVPEMRLDRIAEIRSMIESGQYETEEKLSVALDRLLDEISI